MAVPMVAAGLQATVQLIGLAARTLPELLQQAFCQQIAGPTVADQGAWLERLPAKGDVPASWRFTAARLLAPPRPGPLARTPTAAEQKPVQLELRPAIAPGFVEIHLWTGGWLICALSSFDVAVDGTSLRQMPRAARAVEPLVQVDGRRVHVTASVPESFVVELLSAQTITVRWEGGEVEIRPASHGATRELVELLGQPPSPAPQPE